MMDLPERGFQLLLDVYGVTVGIGGTEASLSEHFGEDFAHFRRETLETVRPHLALMMHREPPPYKDVPPKAATVYTPRNISFHFEGRTYIDFSGQALGILHDAAGKLDVYSTNPDLLYEVGYLFLLSQVGEKLDERHLHRIHALGLSVAEKAAIVLLPMGGGKSTLASHLINDPRVQFLSDDSPIVDRRGDLHAFPLRIGILPGGVSRFAPEQLRTIQRMEFGPKLLLRHSFFAKCIIASASPAFVFLGRRSLSTDCTIQRVSRLKGLRALIPNCVVGLGLFQGMEFVFNRNSGELAKKLMVAVSRLRNCIALVRRSEVYTVVLGRDLERNAKVMLDFMQQKSE